MIRGENLGAAIIIIIACPGPPVLSDLGEVRVRENEEFHLDLTEPGSPPAFPFPSFSWRKDGQPLSNATAARQYGYPSIFIGSVQPSDAGNYTLSAMNYALDGKTLVGSDAGSFTLNVLCKCLATAIIISLRACESVSTNRHLHINHHSPSD